MPDGSTPRRAELYEKHRLPYSPDAAARLLSEIGPVDCVADIGAGTGQLTRLFAPHCRQVWAVEPDPAMVAVATRSLLGSPNVRVTCASAEDTTLPDGSLDLIVIGSAYHRFRPEACTELRRILVSGGTVALFSYTLPKEFSSRLFAGLATLEQMDARIQAAWQRLPLAALFGDTQLTTVEIPHRVALDWESFFGNACSAIEAPEPDDPEFMAFEAINQQVFDEFAVGGELSLQCDTRIRFGVPSPA